MFTPRQQRFIEEYLADLNATQAAIRAGYSARTAADIGRQLLRKTPVARAIQSAQAKRSERLEITVDSITNRLMNIADKAEGMSMPAALSVARQSLMDIAKLNGLVIESHETIVRSPEERSARLAELRAERERITRTH